MKYHDIQVNLKLEFPDFEIDQITLVIDVFGSHSRDLYDNIRKIINGKKGFAKHNSEYMQKTVIKSEANLVRVVFSICFSIRSLFNFLCTGYELEIKKSFSKKMRHRQNFFCYLQSKLSSDRNFFYLRSILSKSRNSIPLILFKQNFFYMKN